MGCCIRRERTNYLQCQTGGNLVTTAPGKQVPSLDPLSCGVVWMGITMLGNLKERIQGTERESKERCFQIAAWN